MPIQAPLEPSASTAQADGKWRSDVPIPQGATEVIGAEVAGKLLVYGGQDPASKPQDLLFAYDPRSRTWSTLRSRAARMIAPRHGFATAAEVGKTIFAVSGVNNADGAGTLSVINVNEEFEP